MTAQFDVLIRNGTVIDGSGAAPVQCDVAISDSRIVAVGQHLGSAKEIIDATGLLVTPGFVDVHTHYDGHATWENRLVPSSAHGVTTAVIGNCGVGFAPCKPDQHELLMRLMEGVEDIPHPVLTEGLPWTWETYPEYLAVLGARQYDMDIASYMPHAALRVYVMGQRGVDREAATPHDIAQMARLLREAMQAGALGFATSKMLLHRSSDGSPIPTLAAQEDELLALAMALKDAGKGVIQMVGDFNDAIGATSQMRRLAEQSGRPLTFSMGTSNRSAPVWPQLLDMIAAANAAGVQMKGQVMPRAIGMILGHELTLNPFYTTSTYLQLAQLPLAEKLAQLRKPEVRAHILAEPVDPNPKNALGTLVRDFANMFELGDPPNYEPLPEHSIAARAQQLGVSAEEYAYDLMLEGERGTPLYLAMANYPNGSLDEVGEMLSHPDVIPGLGDGGAHCGIICDGSYTTFMLTHWARDRTRGEKFSLPAVVKALTSAAANAVSLHDRGLIAAGYKADINIIDFDKLTLHAPTITYDLPAKGRRLIQRADGYVATLINGVTVYRNGQHTGALPGRLVRGPQCDPGVVSPIKSAAV